MKWLAAAAALMASLALGEDRSLFDVKNRFLDGSMDGSKTKLVPSTFIIDSFEDIEATKRDWRFVDADIEASDKNVTDGKSSLKVTFKGKDSEAQYKRGTAGWGDAKTEKLAAWSLQLIFHDEARIDVFNPQDRNVKLAVTMGKPFSFDLKPGRNEVAIRTRDMVDAVYRSTGILSTTKIAVEGDKPVTLFLDNFRWIGPGLGENLVKFGKCLDCGSVEELCRGGFKPLGSSTAYTNQRGYGWDKPSDVEFAYDGQKMISFTSTGRQPHDELFRDMVVRAQGPLLVDLPDGKYRVHWVEGNIFPYPNANLACDYDLSIKVGDKITPIRKAAKDFAERARYIYGRDRADYLPGEDKWKKYLSDWFSPWECDVEVKGGQLKLEFLTDPPGRANLDFILIYPVDKAGVIEPEVAALWNDIRSRFNDLSYQQATVEMAKKMHLPGLHDEFVDPDAAARREKAVAALPAAKDGLVAFARDGVEEVYPDTVPAPESVTNEVSALGPPGEIASMSINLHALKDIKGLKVELGDFASPDGGKIKRADCDLRFVRYSYRMSGQQSHGDWKYMIMPWFLVQRDSIEMTGGMSVRWWLNIGVPADAKPGKYTATARISGDGLAAKDIKLTLDVPPIKLDPVPRDIEFSTLWSIRQEWAPIPDGGYYGLSTRMDPAKAKKWAETLRDRMIERSAAEFKLMKRYGLNLIYNRSEMKEVSVVPIDLPADVAAILPMVDMKDAAARKYVASLRDITEENVRQAKAGGKNPVLFGPPKGWCDIQQEAGIYRLGSGFFLWRIGAGGCLYDPWQDNWGDPYHPFDNHSGEWGSLCVPASTNWPTLNPSVVLEGIREGILDYRYIVTLERLASQNEGKPAAAEAKAYLAKLRESIQPEASAYFQLVGAGGGWDQTWHQKDAAWTGKQFAEARREISRLIAAMQE
ncbi:MAG: hypothetical protein ACE15C_13680 [Phycisphaerae bacterium]